MRAISEKVLDEFEDVALQGAKEIKKFFTYQGKSDPQYLQKAKIGAAAIAAYGRMRASESNRMAVELMIEREAKPRLLKGGPEAA